MTLWSFLSSHLLKRDSPKLRTKAWKDKVGWGEARWTKTKFLFWMEAAERSEHVHTLTNLIPLNNQKPKWDLVIFKSTYKYRAFPCFVLFFCTFACIPLFSIYVCLAPFWPDWKFPLLLFTGLHITAKRELTRDRGGEVVFIQISEVKYWINFMM